MWLEEEEEEEGEGEEDDLAFVGGASLEARTPKTRKKVENIFCQTVLEISKKVKKIELRKKSKDQGKK